MLVKHANDMYSWGEGKVYTGAKAKRAALIDGIAYLGVKDFRTEARKSGIITYQIEMAIAEFRAKADPTVRTNTRDGQDQQDSDTGDISGTIASEPENDVEDPEMTIARLLKEGHGIKTFACGHIEQCRCMTQHHYGIAMAKIARTIDEDCYHCKAYINKKSRDDMNKSDFAWPEERKYPINSQEEVDSAARLLGRAPADKQVSIKRRIEEIAKRKNFSLPKSWK